MRIAYIGPLPPITGGIAQHGAHLVAALRRIGHDVDAWSWKSQYPRWLYKGMESDDSAQPLAGTQFALRWWSPLSWVRVARAARSADVAVVQWVTPFHALPIATMVRSLRHTPAICIVHNVIPHERLPFDRTLTRIALRSASHTIVHSDAQMQLLQGLLPASSVHSIPMPPHLQGIDITPPPPRRPLRLIQPGFVRPYKGVAVALKGIRAYMDRHPSFAIEFSIVGDFWNPTAAETRSLVSDLGLDDVVRIEDRYLSDAALVEEIAAHHAALLPYTHATQSGLIPAVLGLGRPVITTNVGGLMEQIRDGVDSVLCRPNDPESVANAIEKLDSDYESYQAAAVARWPDDSWERLATDLVQIL